MKKTSIYDFIFLIVFILILLGGLVKPIIMAKDVNNYENRPANKLPKINIQAFLNGEFQNKVELAYADQIPLSVSMKKEYNLINNKLKFKINKLYYNKLNNVYIPIQGNINMFGNDDNLVYKPIYYINDIDNINDRINNINESIKNNPKIDFYIYFIDKDTEINFIDNTTTETYEYIKSKINSKNISHLNTNNFETFKDYFYKTDHHWNYKGSFQGYKDVINMIYKNEKLLEPLDTICLNKKYSGSKASTSGTTGIFTDDFCAYQFNIPEHNTYIDGVLKEYGKQEKYFNGSETVVSYGSFYGGDDALIKFDFNNKRDNLLIIGESYDNAINLLLASHFNITYNVDLRNYKDSKFEFSKFIKENKINKVLLIGNYDFFTMSIFNLEG